jgi:hypothetical protein
MINLVPPRYRALLPFVDQPMPWLIPLGNPYPWVPVAIEVTPPEPIAADDPHVPVRDRAVLFLRGPLYSRRENRIGFLRGFHRAQLRDFDCLR